MPTDTSSSAIFTLFEGHYHYGVGVLVNSLYRNGFRGSVWVGYKGPLPPWAEVSEVVGDEEIFEAAEGLLLRFVNLDDVDLFLAHYKATFMLELMRERAPDAERFFYFDPDIVVKGPWTFFEGWVDVGVSLVIDHWYGRMPISHPFRSAWRKYARGQGYEIQREMNTYINSGFVGVTREHAELIEIWHALVMQLESAGVNIRAFKQPGLDEGWNIDRSHPFYGSDQDVLNLSLMLTEVPVSLIGPEAMDFTPGGFTMSHAVDTPKPWKQNLLRQLILKGGLPGETDRLHLQYASGPVAVYSPTALKLKWGAYNVAKVLGTFYHRH